MAQEKSWRRRLRERLRALVYKRSHRMTLRQALAWKAWQLASGANKGAWWPVHPSSVIVHAERIKLGEGSRPGYSNACYIQATNGIEIGDYVLIGPGVGLISADHDPADPGKHRDAPPIKIGNRCWIGKNAVILPGVELGDRVVVGAGAVVTRSFPARSIIAGVPAKIIRRVDAQPAQDNRVEDNSGEHAGDNADEGE